MVIVCVCVPQDATKALEATGVTPQAVSSATSLVTSTAATAANTATPFITKFAQVRDSPRTDTHYAASPKQPAARARGMCNAVSRVLCVAAMCVRSSSPPASP